MAEALEKIKTKDEKCCYSVITPFSSSFLSYERRKLLNSCFVFHFCPQQMFSIWTGLRVLPRNQIQWDKWPSELVKGGPFQKIWGPTELPIYDANGLAAFRQVEKT